MEPREAALQVLRDDPDAELHWTVIWDRALRAGYVDPFTQPRARDEVVAALAAESKGGDVEKTSKGTYRLARASQE
jgi:HB1/ASXL restriction endonuclease-like protein with HTH domain